MSINKKNQMNGGAYVHLVPTQVSIDLLTVAQVRIDLPTSAQVSIDLPTLAQVSIDLSTPAQSVLTFPHWLSQY
jgi:hypothetical protein